MIDDRKTIDIDYFWKTTKSINIIKNYNAALLLTDDSISLLKSLSNAHYIENGKIIRSIDD